MNRFAALCAASAITGGILLSAQTQLPMPRRGFGDSVTGAFEGWYYNPDGSRSFLVGYYNRNSQQELDIPIGPNNRFEPGNPDMGQPTHFLTRRRYGFFVMTLPPFSRNLNVPASISRSRRHRFDAARRRGPR